MKIKSPGYSMNRHKRASCRAYILYVDVFVRHSTVYKIFFCYCNHAGIRKWTSHSVYCFNITLSRIHDYWWYNSVLQASGLDRNLQCCSTTHLIQCCLIVLQLEYICHLQDKRDPSNPVKEHGGSCGTDHSFDIDLATVQVSNSPREAICLGERANDLSESNTP